MVGWYLFRKSVVIGELTSKENFKNYLITPTIGRLFVLMKITSSSFSPVSFSFLKGTPRPLSNVFFYKIKEKGPTCGSKIE